MNKERQKCYFCNTYHRGDCLITALKARIARLLEQLGGPRDESDQ